MIGLRRFAGIDQHGKRALTITESRCMISTLKDDPTSLRDRALLLVSFVSGLRHSELVAIKVGDLTPNEHVYPLAIMRSKSDLKGCTRRVHAPLFGRFASVPSEGTPGLV